MLFDKKIRGAGKWSSSRWNKSNQSKRKKERIITTTACWPPGCVSVEFSVGKVERVRDLKWVKFDCSSITRLGPYSFIDIDVCRLVKRERESSRERKKETWQPTKLGRCLVVIETATKTGSISSFTRSSFDDKDLISRAWLGHRDCFDWCIMSM